MRSTPRSPDQYDLQELLAWILRTRAEGAEELAAEVKRQSDASPDDEFVLTRETEQRLQKLFAEGEARVARRRRLEDDFTRLRREEQEAMERAGDPEAEQFDPVVEEALRQAEDRFNEVMREWAENAEAKKRQGVERRQMENLYRKLKNESDETRSN